MSNFDLKKYLVENKLTAGSRSNETTITKEDALKYAESFDNENVEKDFKKTFNNQKNITKSKFMDFFEKHIDDMSEIKYIQAAWRQLSSGEDLY